MTHVLGRPLVQREHELRVLEATVERALIGAGAAVLITGDAGTGKTTLLDELRARATGRARVLRARGTELDRSQP